MIEMGLIGYPLGHSLSPMIHNAFLDLCGMEGNYRLFTIAPGDVGGLEQVLDRVRSGELSGLNVTIPHKKAVLALLDELTPTAKAVGAVNTIFLHEGKLSGENTDVAAFLGDMQEQLSPRSWEKMALVLGAGGSARAVVYGLVHSGWTVTLAARRPDQAETLTAQFPQYFDSLDQVEFSAEGLEAIASSTNLIVNTTPVGMFPETGVSPWPEGLPFPQDAAVYDLVYNPRETRLVRESRAKGLTAISGWGMLVEQAAQAFELWLDCSLPRESLLNVLEEK